MKRILTFISTLFIMSNLFAQGRFEVLPLNNAELHVYYSNDVMADASYIVEGRDGLVVLETPLFKSALKEFNDYLTTLGKPVVAMISDYHVGGTGDHKVIMASGMRKFTTEGVYAAMMSGFRKSFGDTMVDLPTGAVEEVPFGSTRTIAGVNFEFRHGSDTDFPAASIIIDGTAYMTHWAPAKAHLNSLQISSRAAVKAELASLDDALTSGAKYYIGGHLGAADVDALKFKIAYLHTIESLLSKCSDAQSLARALKDAYPGLPGEEGVDALAAGLYSAAN